MKVVLLAGGLGTRISEESNVKPKPMVEIGGKPILWHIIKYYSTFGLNEFVICLGYKGYVIKEYFQNYFLHQSDITFDLSSNTTEVHCQNSEPWKISLIDTGEYSMTGGRIKRIKEYVGDETFMMTYGDGVSTVDIAALLEHHKSSRRFATVTAVQPPGRFGSLDLSPNSDVKGFVEKPKGDGSWINGGYFVLEPSIFDYIDGDSCVWEQGPLEQLAKDGQLSSFKHYGFWQPIDTLRDKNTLESLISQNQAPWMVWK